LKASLNRFLLAQDMIYETALNKMRFGNSYTCIYDGINGNSETQQHLNHSILRERLIEISKALLAIDYRTAHAIFGFAR